MTNDCNVIAYGCYNGSVRLYYLDSSAVKTLGSHQEKVIDLAVNIEIMPDTQMEMVVVVSGKGTRILGWLNPYFFAAQIQIQIPIQNKYLGLG